MKKAKKRGKKLVNNKSATQALASALLLGLSLYLFIHLIFLLN